MYTCQSVLKDWAKIYCRHYCGYCGIQYLNQATSPATNSPLQVITTTYHVPTKTKICRDKLPDCADYGDRSYACHGINEPWARDNCNSYCGFCSATTAMPTKQTTTVTTHHICKDLLQNCPDYGDPSYACHGKFETWGKVNCYKYCGHCGLYSPTTQAPVPTTKTTQMVTTPFKCEDKIINCYAYGQTNYSCTGRYSIWARENCARHCGFCHINIPTTASSGSFITPIFFTFATPSTTARNCHNQPLDIHFLIDASGSIGYRKFDDAKQFIKRLLQGYRIDDNHVKVGVTTFSNRVKEEFSFNTYHNMHDVVNGIQRLQYYGGSTYTDNALQHVLYHSFTSYRGDRPNVKDVLIIMTDGHESHHHNPTREEQMLQNRHITTYAIGIGYSISNSHLYRLTGDRSHIYSSSSTQGLHNALWKELGIC